MDPAALAFLLLAVGLLLIAAEFFLPSGGIIGLFATLAIVVSIYEAKIAFGSSQPGLFYVFIMIVLLAVPGTIAGMLHALRNSKRGEELFLAAPIGDDMRPFEETGIYLQGLVGQFGEAVSDLQPSGIARVDGERLDVVSEGTLIEAGSPIKVIGVRSVYPVVRLADPDEVAAFHAAAEAPPEPIEQTPFLNAQVDEPPPPERSDDDYADPFALDNETPT